MYNIRTLVQSWGGDSAFGEDWEYNMSKNLVIFHAAKLLNPDIPHKTKVVIKL